ncbi:hypothetical protein KDW55_26545 [Burkholderia sp. AU19243]|uniref:Uncharacterized protein n=1 Tax=Burkholderia latens TaxID=488446 RepID=A0AAP1G922_9BURK|nr:MULTISPECIES: hypothetical protein [Burkholderia]AIO40603.1 hypothetical protein DM40_30 [Burkholderia cenocepacia]MBR7961876.1 hypothetical protein [Burkholderia vietnamiensis]AOK05044.1 hypothetical protein WK25_11605 [Burkholderia latens]KVA05240.1 hypothetical protein WI41_18125 [Burkholderia latens]MBR8145984.1 hypothetical protein [Burkholderia vietnamiensis]
MRRPKRLAPRRPDADAERARPQTDAPGALPAGTPDDTPSDGDHNQGGARPEGLDYQRDLGQEQDA